MKLYITDFLMWLASVLEIKLNTNGSLFIDTVDPRREGYPEMIIKIYKQQVTCDKSTVK